MIKTLYDLMIEFIEYKRQNGYTYITAEYHLKKYLNFSNNYAPGENIPQKNTEDLFLKSYTDTPGNLYNIVATLREFSRYLIGMGYTSAYLIPSGKVKLPTPVLPYLFTVNEINKFFIYCDNIDYDCHVMKRHIVLPALYRLFYCCGLRCKEVRTLKNENVHLMNNYIDILQSKGPKSRRIFISHELSNYLRAYNQRINAIMPNRIYFFPSRNDAPYCASAFECNFKKIWYTAFPEKKYDGISVRAYDFRHHFAYANMNRWLREGKDINVMLPYLMKYMGHQDKKSTLYYFHLVPDIYDAIVGKSSFFEELLPEVSSDE